MGRRRDVSQELDHEEWTGFITELQRETDRGAAVVGASLLDHLLGQLIASFLIDDKQTCKELLGSSYAPLGTLAARIAAAFCLGLISADERHDLMLVKAIRNLFAHGLSDLSFEDEGIQAKCLKLKLPRLSRSSGPGAPVRSPRQLFTNAVSMLATFLEMRRKSVERREPPERCVLAPPGRRA